MRIKTNMSIDELIQNMQIIKRIVSDEVPVDNIEYYSKMMKTCDVAIEMLEEKKNNQVAKNNWVKNIIDKFKNRSIE